MPAYHRLDVSLNYKVKKKKWDATWSFSIYNIYNKLNAFAYRINNQNHRIQQVALFPILPSISYKVKF